MRRVWITVLGILNLIAFGSLTTYYIVWLLASASDAFTWGLPVLVAAVVALICGIFTLKRKSWGWAVAGLFTACVLGIYLLALTWFLSWTMA
jgi:hypothetical protein